MILKRAAAHPAAGVIVTGSRYNLLMPDSAPTQSRPTEFLNDRPGPGSRPGAEAARIPPPGAATAQPQRFVPIPDGAPPFDDEEPGPGSLPVPLLADDRPDQDGPLAPRPLAPRLPGRPADPWPSHFAQALAEALGGTRPATQLVPWTTIQTRKRINQLSPRLATSQRPRLRRLIVTSPAADVLEMALVISFGPRVRAVAVRLERGGPARVADPSCADPSDVGRPAGPRPTQPPGRPGRADRWYCTAVEAA